MIIVSDLDVVLRAAPASLGDRRVMDPRQEEAEGLLEEVHHADEVVPEHRGKHAVQVRCRIVTGRQEMAGVTRASEAPALVVLRRIAVEASAVLAALGAGIRRRREHVQPVLKALQKAAVILRSWKVRVVGDNSSPVVVHALPVQAEHMVSWTAEEQRVAAG
eukprot:scaffold7643_cov267-Pinguiococcus_pyrenoidosus.AAC.3